jgi:hypothetical protein
MTDFKTRKGGSRKTVDIKDIERLQPFNSKEVQLIFNISHQTIAERKKILGIQRKPVGWAELNVLYLLHIFVSSKYQHHTYYQFQNLYHHCLNNGLSIEIEVFQKMLMLNTTQLFKEFKVDVLSRISSYRQHNGTGTYRVISELTETPNPDGTTETA